MRQEERQNIRVQVAVTLIGCVLLGGKMAAYILTGSVSILTDALESIVNVVAGSFALYSLILAAKPKDTDHPYGHGKIEFISASVEGTLIVLAGLSILVKAVLNFFEKRDLLHLDTGMIIIAATGVINYITGWIMEQRGRSTGSIVLAAGANHLKTDAYSTVAILAGLGIIYVSGWMWADSVVAIIAALVICYTGYRILRRSVSGIMDEADRGLLHEVIVLLQEHRRSSWIDVHNMRVIRYGAMLHIDCHITVPYYYSVAQAHAELEAVDALVNRHFGNRVELFIHTDPCIEESCRICSLHECPVRKHAQEKTIVWTEENVMRNKKHHL